MRRRLILTYLAITVFVLVAVEVPFGVLLVRSRWERVTVGLERDAGVLATVYEDALDNGAAYGPQAAYDYSARTGTRVIIVDDTGVSIVDSSGPPNRDFSSRPEIVSALAGERVAGRRPSTTLDRELIYVAVPVASGGVVHGAVRLTLDAGTYDASVREVWFGLVATALVVLLGTSAAGWVLAGSTVRPVRGLSAAVARFRATGAPLAADGIEHAPPELVELASAFTDMGDRVNDVVDRHRRFVADASHQLRSPLTALRLRLENLAAESDRPEMLDTALAEVDRLTTLVTQLLHLARSEGWRATRVTVDLGAAVRDRCALWEAVAVESGCLIETDLDPGPLLISTPEGAIDQVLDNLLSNAIAVSPAGSKVRVVMAGREGWAVLHIQDEGPGLSPEDRALAFDRFWTGPHSTGASGLGLAIVSELVTQSGGSVRLDQAPGGGVDAVVEFPR
jgi:signal transduction histidine kinase